MSSSSVEASRALREGLNHLSRNNTSQALSFFQHALIHDPSLTEAYNKLATVESTEKHPVTSLKYSLQTLQHISCHYSAHAMTGISLLSMTKSVNSVRYNDALKSLTESLELNPWSGWLATKLMILKTTSGRKIESVVKRKTGGIKFVTQTTTGQPVTDSKMKKKGTLIEFDIIHDKEEEINEIKASNQKKESEVGASENSQISNEDSEKKPDSNK